MKWKPLCSESLYLWHFSGLGPNCVLWNKIYSFNFSITVFSELVTNVDKKKKMKENRFACSSFRIFKFCLQTVPSIAKASNVAGVILLHIELHGISFTQSIIDSILKWNIFSKCMKYDLFIDFHTLSVVEIGYHIRYTSSIADYFDSWFFLFTLESSFFYSRIFLP